VNDWENGLIKTFRVAREPAPGLAYKHHQTARTTRTRTETHADGPSGHVADYGGKLDLGPWEQVFMRSLTDSERNGRRQSRDLVKDLRI
jgi:thiamine phosphate synthase YjbQ (UPF0047 family)